MRRTFLLFAWLTLTSCSLITTSPQIPYQGINEQSPLYQLKRWGLQGRVAVMSQKDSWQASLDWYHEQHHDTIRLSGPLGQGGVVIDISDEHISIDKGDGQVLTSEQPQALIAEQVGLVVPVDFLRYWVLGLSEKGVPVKKMDKGFEQAGWQVQYKSMQNVQVWQLPHHLVISDGQVKVKLFIDEWQLDAH